MDKDFQLMTPGRPWWQRDRFNKKYLAETPRPVDERPPSPVPFGAALNVEVLKNDGRLSETDDFQASRPDLKHAGVRTVRRELLKSLAANHDVNEVPRETALGPDFFGLDADQAADKLMEDMETTWGGKFPLFYSYLQNREFAIKCQSSALVRKSIRPRSVYGPPPHHPDAMDGYATHRAKHEATMNRLYGPSSGRVHTLPDKPDTWLRRDGLKAGIPGIQSFTFYAHELQNAGYGAP